MSAAAADRHGVIRVEGLRKRCRGSPAEAVAGVDLAVGADEVFGLLGPNGAGETTTIGVPTTRVRPAGGRALVDGPHLGAGWIAPGPAASLAPFGALGIRLFDRHAVDRPLRRPGP